MTDKKCLDLYQEATIITFPFLKSFGGPLFRFRDLIFTQIDVILFYTYSCSYLF